jgi:hypothetical protein
MSFNAALTSECVARVNSIDPSSAIAKPASSPPAVEPLDPRLRDLYRSATPTQKLAIVARLNAALIALKEANLRTSSVVCTPDERKRLLRSWWLGARD